MSRNNRKPIKDDWLSSLADNLDKQAVQPVKERSLYDQINNIMNGGIHSKFSTVEDVVKDMQERCGLTAHLSKTSGTESEDVQKKSANNSFLDSYPEIINTIENLITSSRGTLPVPAIIAKIRNLHENDVNDNSFFDDDRLISFISQRNLKEKSTNFREENYNNLGKSDNSIDDADEPWNTDPFYGIDA